MTMKDWREVQEADARKLLEELADHKWDFRTVEGLTRSTGLPVQRVKELLEKYKELVRTFPMPDTAGNTLYTIGEKSESLRETLTKISSIASKRAVKRAK